MFRRLTLAAVMALSLFGGAAEAQTDVAYALVPKIGDGLSPFTAFRPKYADPGSLGAGLDLVGWAGMDYGVEPVFLIRVALSAAQRTALQSQPDAMVIPSNLDNVVSALALAGIQQKLESVNLPAHWITADMTYRQVLRGFRRVITFMQRWHGLGFGRLFEAGVTLDTRLNQLTAQQRTRLSNVADDLGLDRSTVTNTMTLRQVLKLLADQLPDVTLGGDAV
jgi:hypothetical protein